MNEALRSAFARKAEAMIRTGKDLTPGGRYAGTDGRILVDTGRLRLIEGDLGRIRGRLDDLEGRIARLQVKAGMRGICSLIQVGLLTESRLRLRKCCGYLKGTADRFEQAERLALRGNL